MNGASSNRRVASRAALTSAVVLLVGGAAVDSALSAGTRAPARRQQPHPTPAAARALAPSAGEPQLAADSSVPRAVRAAAVAFVRDYGAWSAGTLAEIPPRDASAGVIRALELAGRRGTRPASEQAASVRLGPAGAGRYVATSAIGNFLVGQIDSRWAAISLPGD